MENKIVEFSTKKVKGVFVKVPNNIFNLQVQVSHVGTILWYGDHTEECQFMIDLSKEQIDYKIIGFSHQISEEQMKQLGFEYLEYIKLLTKEDITFNYSAWTGQWVVLAVEI